MSITAQDIRAAKEQADNLLQPYIVKNAPGGMAAVFQGGALTWSRHFGLADMAGYQPNLPGTRHAIASVSKMMTAALVLKLVARGRLDLQVAASTYIPDVPMLEQMTIAHLLTMTGGVPDHFDLMALAGGLPGHDRDVSDYLAIMQKMKEPITEPGTRHIYGNANYLLLAEIIKGVTGKTFAQAMQDEIFRPAGMKDAYILNNNTEIHPRTALPHVAQDDGSWTRGRVRFPADGIGNAFCSLSDFAAWFEVLRSGTLDNTDISALWGETLIGDKKSVQYGLGMMLRKYRGLSMRGHMGRWAGYRSALFYAPELDMGFVLMANRSDFPIEDMLFGLVDAFAGKALPAPPLDAQIMANISKAALPMEALPRLNGTYIHPESGGIIKLHWQMPYLMAETTSTRMLMQCTSHGFFTARWGTSSCHVMPQADKASKTIALDVIMGGVRSRYARIETLGPVVLSTQDYTGDYLFETFDARMSVFDRGGRLYARIGTLINGGEAYPLLPLGADTFEMRDPSVDVHARYTLRFDREPSSRIVRQLLVSGDRLPRVVFRKLRSF